MATTHAARPWLLSVSLGVSILGGVALAGESPDGPAEPLPPAERPPAERPTERPAATVTPRAGGGATIRTPSTGATRPVGEGPAPARPAPAKPSAAGKQQVVVPGRATGPAEQYKGPLPAAGAAPADATVIRTKKPTVKLAPSAAELQAERQLPEGERITPLPQKPRDPRDATPSQFERAPTRVDYTRGPGSSLGGGTAGDRKATVQDATGPQTGVIRNRW